MIQLLFSLVLAEMTLMVLFMFRTPMRKLVIMGLDLVKRGHGPIVVKMVATAVFLLMLLTVYNAEAIQRRWIHDGAEADPMDQVLLANHLLEASLMGFSLFLALMVHRLHLCVQEMRARRKTMEAAKKQNRVFDDSKSPAPEEIKVREDEMGKLRRRIGNLERELEEKSKEAGSAEANAKALKRELEVKSKAVVSAEANAKALKRELEVRSKEVGSVEANSVAFKKQSEGFHHEYEQLLEENKNLRSQLKSLDRKFSSSKGKKKVM